MRKPLAAAFVLAGLIAGCNRAHFDNAQTDTTRADIGDRVSADTRILSILAAKDREEVDMGRLAQSNGASQGVKDFGGRLERDHGDHERKVQALARSSGIELKDAAEVTKMLAREKGTAEPPDHMGMLQGLQGAEFDRRFAEMMRDGHREVIRIVQDAQGKVQNQEVKALLAATLPVLQEHERIASQLAGGAGR